MLALMMIPALAHGCTVCVLVPGPCPASSPLASEVTRAVMLPLPSIGWRAK